jgi:hypothetical protein
MGIRAEARTVSLNQPQKFGCPILRALCEGWDVNRSNTHVATAAKDQPHNNSKMQGAPYLDSEVRAFARTGVPSQLAGWGGKARTVLLPPAVNPRPRTHSQNGNPQKINPASVAYFSTPKYDHQFTTKSPQCHHKFTIKKPRSTTRFPQNPLQKHKKPPSEKNTIQRGKSNRFSGRSLGDRISILRSGYSGYARTVAIPSLSKLLVPPTFLSAYNPLSR